MSISVASLMINAGPLFGAGAALTTAASTLGAGVKLYAGAATLALAACGVLEKFEKTASKPSELGEYPFSSTVANPWDRDGGPAGL